MERPIRPKQSNMNRGGSSRQTKKPGDMMKIYIDGLEELATHGENPWIDQSKLISFTGTTSTQFSRFLSQSRDIVVNSRGKITTRRIYKAKTPFMRRLGDSYKGIIE